MTVKQCPLCGRYFGVGLLLSAGHCARCDDLLDFLRNPNHRDRINEPRTPTQNVFPQHTGQHGAIHPTGGNVAEKQLCRRV